MFSSIAGPPKRWLRFGYHQTAGTIPLQKVHCSDIWSRKQQMDNVHVPPAQQNILRNLTNDCTDHNYRHRNVNRRSFRLPSSTAIRAQQPATLPPEREDAFDQIGWINLRGSNTMSLIISCTARTADVGQTIYPTFGRPLWREIPIFVWKL